MTWRSLAQLLTITLLGMSAALFAQSSVAQTDVQAYVQAQRALPRAPQLPRTAFMEERALASVQLSPTGDAVAYLREHKSARSLWLLPVATGKPRLLLARTQADRVLWSLDGRWLFLRAGNTLDSVAADGHPGVRVPLGGLAQRQLMKIDPSQPAAVLLRERVSVGMRERWRIVRMDAHGKRSVLREGAHWIRDVAVDASGNLAALVRFEGDANVLYRVQARGALQKVLRLQPLQKVNLLAACSDGSLLMNGNPGGNFYRVLRLTADNSLHTLHRDPRGEADLDEVVLDPQTQQPLAASYRSSVAATYGIGGAQAVVADIVKKFPGRDVALQASTGPGAVWLVAERAATLREPRWYLYNRRDGSLRRILEAAASTSQAPTPSALVRKLAISYVASDGVRVHGFLLLPAGVDTAHAALIAQVHGGPINHFRAGYDGVAQFLANRGYIVFQSNFRGSTGHGQAYMFASNGDYGNGRVQQDSVEGVRWLLAQGIGDADRVGITGHSFGGYSTLLGLTFQPELFKVGVAGAPPADLGWGMRWLLAAGDQGDLPDRSLQRILQALSLDASNPAIFARLHAQSPQVHAATLRRPLLIMAGGSDRTVALRSVTDYVARLHALERPVSLLVEPNGGHSPVAPIPREAYLFAMETMLHAHLGGTAPQPPGPRLQAYLQRNLRLAGPEFADFAK